jgi:type I restriction enzyme S subunit
MSWAEVNLGDVIRLKRGHDLPASARVPGAVPIVSSSGVTGFHNVPKVTGPGVVTGRYGTLGEVHYIEDDYWPLNTALYVEDFKGNLPRFVAYLLMTLELGSQNSAGAVPGINRNVLHQMKVRIPTPITQRRIVEVLGTYDALIAINQRRITLLEDAARRLYREWFVHLRFPGHESVPVKDGVPQGWQRSTFSRLVHINPRTPFLKDVVRPFVEMSALSENSMVIGKRAMRVIGGGAKFKNNDTLFARITRRIQK